jgi:hypothetical protein
MAINNITIDDDNSGGTSGNGNGIIESGETVDLGFVMKNNGTATSGTVTVVLRSSDAGVTVSDSTAGGGTVTAGGTGTMTGGCRVVFASSLTDQHAVPFTLIIKNNAVETWKDTFKKLSHRPSLSLVKLRVDDTVTGNGDGVVQAGEQFKLYYKAKNFGTGSFPGGTMTSFDLDGAFTIGGGGTSAYPVIASLASARTQRASRSPRAAWQSSTGCACVSSIRTGAHTKTPSSCVRRLRPQHWSSTPARAPTGCVSRGRQARAPTSRTTTSTERRAARAHSI